MTAFDRSPCGTACACGSIFGEKAGERHHLDDPEPRDEAVLAIDGGDEPGMIVIALQAFEEVEIVLEDHLRLPHPGY